MSGDAQWMHVWTNFGSGDEGVLDVFLFKFGDNKIRISSIFPEGQDARQYMMQKMERGFYLIPFDQSNVIEVINLDNLDAVNTPEGLILEEMSEVAQGPGNEEDLKDLVMFLNGQGPP